MKNNLTIGGTTPVTPSSLRDSIGAALMAEQFGTERDLGPNRDNPFNGIAFAPAQKSPGRSV